MYAVIRTGTLRYVVVPYACRWLGVERQERRVCCFMRKSDEREKVLYPLLPTSTMALW